MPHFRDLPVLLDPRGKGALYELATPLTGFRPRAIAVAVEVEDQSKRQPDYEACLRGDAFMGSPPDDVGIRGLRHWYQRRLIPYGHIVDLCQTRDDRIGPVEASDRYLAP